MSSFWALSATKKRNDLVPGTSKWVAHELATINDEVLTHNEQVFHSLKEGYNEMNVFMAKALLGMDKRNHHDDDITAKPLPIDPTANFTYVSPILDSLPQYNYTGVSKQISHSPAPGIPTSMPITPSPLKESSPPKPNPITSPNIDFSFIPIANTINPNNGNQLNKKQSDEPDLDDSFQAISTAIRKSIAGKTASRSSNYTSKVSEPESEADVSKKSEPEVPARKSFQKTPKRASIFVSLPSREPITIAASSKPVVKSRSLRVFEQLDIASRHEPASKKNTNFELSPVILPRNKKTYPDKPSPFASKLIHPDLKPANSPSPEMPKIKTEPTNQGTIVQKTQLVKLAKLPVTSTNRKEVTSATPREVTTSPKARNPSSGRKIVTSATRNKSPLRHISPVKNKSPAKHRSPVRSKSPTRSPLGISPVQLGTAGLSKEKEETMIERLTAPTSTSAAKRASDKIGKRLDINTKNKFLTTTLIPTHTHLSKSHFTPGKDSTKVPSPIKKRTEELESRNTQKLDASFIPTLKKKSMMAERSEAAAQKPKQKILISMNHKLELKPGLKMDGRKTLDSKDKGEKPIKSVKRDIVRKTGNAVALPEAARGNFDRSGESAKRRKTNREEVTPVRADRSRILGKKTFRASGTKSPFSKEASEEQYTPESLPDIHTDEEDNGTNHQKVLQSWGHTPELHKILMKNRDVNPATVFGEVPKLNIEEIFDSHTSRQRGGESPVMTHNEKVRQREEKQYALDMGYKD